jgi:hypothetical protein
LTEYLACDANDFVNPRSCGFNPPQLRSGRQVTRTLCKHLLRQALLEPVPSASVWVETVVKVRL